MENRAIIYHTKLMLAIREAEKHLLRIDDSFHELSRQYAFPISPEEFESLLSNNMHLAFADQIIYRFSKAQDTIGAKLFKAFMLYQGENVDKPLLDILNSLEKIKILEVETWFELREIRNEIAHDYDNEDEQTVLNILNSIFKHKESLKTIIENLKANSSL